MRFCPYCGAELIAEGVQFCAECGKKLPAKAEKEDNKDSAEAGEPLQEYRSRKKIVTGEKEVRERKQSATGGKGVRERKQREKIKSVDPFGKKEKTDGKQTVGKQTEKVIHKKDADKKKPNSGSQNDTDILQEKDAAEQVTKTECQSEPGKAELPERKPYSDMDDYDGYYDDILPVDEGHDSEGLDGELIKKIVLLITIVLFIIGMCVALMYVL